jgi:hypothetical protein
LLEGPDMPSDSVNANMPSAAATSLGRSNFVALAGQHSPERQDMLKRILASIDEAKLEVVRVGFVDTHGIV